MGGVKRDGRKFSTVLNDSLYMYHSMGVGKRRKCRRVISFSTGDDEPIDVDNASREIMKEELGESMSPEAAVLLENFLRENIDLLRLQLENSESTAVYTSPIWFTWLRD